MLRKFAGRVAVLVLLAGLAPASIWAQPARTETGQGIAVHAGGEANLVVPDLSVVEFGGINGRVLLMSGLLICALGLFFGLTTFTGLKNLPVHSSMREVSELIYETCKTYLLTQGRFILILWTFIAAIMVAYYGWLNPIPGKSIATTLPVILAFSLIGIGGSYGVAWFGIRVNTFANSRAAFASLRGMPFPIYAIPLRAGMSIGMLLISVELLIMLCILLFIPGDYAGPCFIGFAIGESLGAAALRIAGGIFTKIADIGSDLMKIVFNIKEDDARNPGVIADCTGDNAGDSVGPSADGFETYGVTGVALISFILLAVTDARVQVQLLVWIFVMRIMMIVASGVSYFVNEAIARGRYLNAPKMNFEAPLTSLVWLTSIVSVVITYLVSYWLVPDLGDGSLWWKLSTIITCGTLAGAIIPEFVKIFTSTESSHVKEVVTSSQEGGPSLNILSGFVAGNFSAYWLGLSIVTLDGHRLLGQRLRPRSADAGPGGVRVRTGRVRLPGHGTGHDRRRFLRAGHRQRAVDLRALDDRAGAGHQAVAQARAGLRRQLRARQGSPRGERRRRQHVQGDRQTGADWDRGGRRDDDDLLDHRDAHRGPDHQHRQVVDPPPAVPARADHRRRDDLLVHRRVGTGGDDRRVPRRGVHQGEHPPRRRREGVGRRQQEGGGDLHAVRAARHVQHLPDGLLRDAGVRVLSSRSSSSAT